MVGESERNCWNAAHCMGVIHQVEPTDSLGTFLVEGEELL